MTNTLPCECRWHCNGGAKRNACKCKQSQSPKARGEKANLYPDHGQLSKQSPAFPIAKAPDNTTHSHASILITRVQTSIEFSLRNLESSMDAYINCLILRPRIPSDSKSYTHPRSVWIFSPSQPRTSCISNISLKAPDHSIEAD